MKVLMICTEKLPVPPILGGAIQTYISGSLPHLSEVHDITVLGISDSSLPNRETIDGIHYVRVPGKVFEIYREGVVGYVESNQFDLIHIFNRPRLVMPIRNVAPQTKITLSMHNDMFYPEKIDTEEAKAVIEEVSNIVTISNYVGNVIRDLYPQASSKLRTIYSGVDTERFLPGNHSKMQKTRNEIRKENGLENKTVILFAGRLSNNKGVDKLVRALPELSTKFNDLALVIVGSKWFSDNEVTDYVAYVRALAKKLSIPVVTTGFVAPSEIQKWFAAADLFVCTSLWQEPLARVHYEAMAAGLPIVTTTRGGNAEVILVGENGLLVENPEDPSSFAEKIAEILSDKSLMNKMGKKGRELAISLYGWERVASDLLEVWEQSIKMPAIATAQPAAEESLDDIVQPAAEESSNHISQTTAEESPDDIVQPAAEESPDDIVQPAAEESPDDIVQPAAEESPDDIVQPAAEESPDDIVQPAAEESPDDIVQPAAEEATDDIVQPAAEEPPDDMVQPAAEESSDDIAQPAAEGSSDDIAQPATDEASDDIAQPATDEASDDIAQPAADDASDQNTESRHADGDDDSHHKKKRPHADGDSHHKKKRPHADGDSHHKKKRPHADGDSHHKKKRPHADGGLLHKKKSRLAQNLITMISENIGNIKKTQEDDKILMTFDMMNGKSTVPMKCTILESDNTVQVTIDMMNGKNTVPMTLTMMKREK